MKKVYYGLILIFKYWSMNLKRNLLGHFLFFILYTLTIVNLHIKSSDLHQHMCKFLLQTAFKAPF